MAFAAAAGAVGTFATVATYAGLAMTAVGLITGNKSLAKIGGFLGLAGGVTGLVGSAAGGAGAAAGGATSAAEAASGAAGNVGNAAQATIAGGDATAAFAGEAPASIFGGTAPVLDAAGNVVTAAKGAGTTLTPSGGSPAQTAMQVDKAASPLSQTSGGPLAPPTPKEPGLIERIMNWGQKHPLLAYGAMQTVGGALEKGFSKDPAEERNAMELQALQEKIARANAIPGSLGVRPNLQANLYPEPYQSPVFKRGIINQAR